MKRSLILIMLCIIQSSVYAQTNNEIFLKMIGNAALFDSSAVKIVLQKGAGAKYSIDTNNDGRIDTIYFIDNDKRHGNLRQPLLVKVFDEDGDMYKTGSGDHDSDIYIADWYGDGSIDRVIDYIDNDNDNDLDEQVLYQWSDMQHFIDQASSSYNGRAYSAAWTKDYGDDNLLWYDINYEYEQELTQWKTDFNGDEMFVYAFFYDFDQNYFVPGFENPFAFYDNDNDMISEEVIRVGASGFEAHNLRYSLDVDNDADKISRHDYDFSITAVGKTDFSPDDCMSLELRGVKTGLFLKWENVKRAVMKDSWSKLHLTWDENDCNIDITEGQNHSDRWEGVINYGNDYFPQTGGPSCGPFNKRNEVDSDNSGKFQLYFSETDKRYHLFGAEKGWIKTDYDYDGVPEITISFYDTNNNGFFDLWIFDMDNDGVTDREFRVVNDFCRLIEPDYEKLNSPYTESLKKAIAENKKIINELKKYAKITEKNKIEKYFDTELIKYDKDFDLGKKIKESMEGQRYYTDIIRETYWYDILKNQFSDKASFQNIVENYDNGNYDTTIILLKNLRK